MLPVCKLLMEAMRGCGQPQRVASQHHQLAGATAGDVALAVRGTPYRYPVTANDLVVRAAREIKMNHSRPDKQRKN